MLTKRWEKLKPHKEQARLWNNTINYSTRFNVVPAGRRCLERGTMVATPNGPKPIESLAIGDNVIGYNELGNPEITEITEVHDNGLQLVYPLYSCNKKYLAATENHKLFSCHEGYYDKRRPHLKNYENIKYKKREIKDITERHRVKKCYAYELIEGGNVSFSNAYALGFIIGNGCCSSDKIYVNSENIKHLYISDGNEEVIKKISNDLNGTYHKNSNKNYTWTIKLNNSVYDSIPYYEQWCSGKLAHEKFVDWEVIDQWNKKTCLKFLAGVIDSDGSIYKKENNLILNISMQSKSTVEACMNIIYKYFQEFPNFYIDDREKYKNSDVYCMVISSNLLFIRVYNAIKKNLVKKCNFETKDLKERNLLIDRIGFNKKTPYQASTFDITVANKTNLYLLHDGAIVTSNSGKTEIIGKRKIVYRALRGTSYDRPRFFAAAPTRQQAKKIYWVDLKALVPKKCIHSISESELIIFLKNSSEIHVLGMDKPERIEGSPWDGGVLDEFGNMKSKTWEEHVRPALSDRKGWCDFIGVPEGRNHYYKVANFAKEQKISLGAKSNWDYFHWISADILDPEEIIEAKNELDELTYQQEYEASFVDFFGRAYYNFTHDTHCVKLSYDKTKDLIFCFDFNVSPGVAVIIQEQNYIDPKTMLPIIGQTVSGVIGEVYIPKNSNTILVCNKLIKDWGSHEGSFYCYGDSTGGSGGSAKVQGSDWDLIKQSLKVLGPRVYYRVPSKNPNPRARVNAVNSRLKTVSGIIGLQVDPSKAPNVVKDFEGVRTIEGGSGEIDKSDLELTHLSDAVGYYICKVFPVSGKKSSIIETSGL